MVRIGWISLFVIGFFLIEFLLFNFLGAFWTPDLLLLLTIFFNLYAGIRYGIVTALLAGLIKDSFSITPFGLHTFSFLLCAYMTTFLKQYIYHMGSSFSRLILVGIICLMNILIHGILYLMGSSMDFGPAIKALMMPQLLLTLFIADSVFTQFKKCVLRLSV